MDDVKVTGTLNKDVLYQTLIRLATQKLGGDVSLISRGPCDQWVSVGHWAKQPGARQKGA